MPVENIKTNGDSYIAAGGLPENNRASAQDVVQMALEMQNFMQQSARERQERGRPYFTMRIGIHSGPVVAGVAGIKKFQYDIWGDTVNTAARMESSGETGKVNISQSTYELLEDVDGFSFEKRGKVQAKNKGMMEMYFVQEIDKQLQDR